MPLNNEPVDLGNEPTSSDFTPDAPAASGNVVYEQAGGGLGNDPEDIGNDPTSSTVVPAVTTQPGSAQTVGPIIVSYVPGVNAALTITPGTLDAAGNFTPGPVIYGPYPAVVTQTGSQYALTVTTSDPVAGAVSIQPGDLSGDVFNGIGSALTGTLEALKPVQFTTGSPVSDIVGGDSTILAGSDAVISVLVSLDNPQPDASGDLSTDPTGYPVSLVLSATDVTQGVLCPATWLSVTSGPYAGAWAQAVLSSAAGTSPGPGVCNVFVILGSGSVRQAGIIRVQGE